MYEAFESFQRLIYTSTSILCFWRPLLPYGYSYKASCILCQTRLSRRL